MTVLCFCKIYSDKICPFFDHIFRLRYYYDTQDITCDQELQNFANELSADGVGSTGGMGMVGMPKDVRKCIRTSLELGIESTRLFQILNRPLKGTSW